VAENRSHRNYSLLIGDAWVPAQSGKSYDSHNPYTDHPWATVPDGGSVDVDAAVRAARAALDGPWGAMTGFERAGLLRELAVLLARDAQALAELESRDNGKLLRETQGQMKALPDWLNYFAGIADKIQGDVIPSDRRNFMVYTRHEPVGVIGAIVPWNSPLLLLMWKLAPALAAGCSLVVKPSDYTPVTALELGSRVLEAGIPAGVFNVVTGFGPEVGRALVSHPDVDRIAFTGSTSTGRAIARAAAENLTRTSLELGGKSAQLVFPDADLDAACNGIIAGIFAASGQTCIAGSRLIVHESIHDDLVDRLVDRARTIRLGDPLDMATEMGPLANVNQLNTVLGLLERATERGAKVATGGRTSPDHGALFFEPTVLTGVQPDMEVAQEEIFGPVLSVLTFAEDGDAVRMANATKYGLAAGLWTRDFPSAHDRSFAEGWNGMGQLLPRRGAERPLRWGRRQRLGAGERSGRGQGLHRDQGRVARVGR